MASTRILSRALSFNSSRWSGWCHLYCPSERSSHKKVPRSSTSCQRTTLQGRRLLLRPAIIQEVEVHPLKLRGSANWPCRGAMWIFWPDFWVEFWKVNFGRWISRRWIFQGASFPGKNRTKKFDPRIWVRNSGVQNSFSRIRAQIRVSEVQNPRLSLREGGLSKTTCFSELNGPGPIPKNQI